MLTRLAMLIIAMFNSLLSVLYARCNSVFSPLSSKLSFIHRQISTVLIDKSRCDHDAKRVEHHTRRQSVTSMTKDCSIIASVHPRS